MNELASLLLMPGLFLLLQIVGLILALVYWNRCPSACGLLFSASLLSMIANLAQVGLVIVHPGGNLPFLGFIPVLSILNWLAYALMLLAIFVGRNEPAHPALQSLPPDDDWKSPAQTSAAQDNSGIKVQGRTK